MSQEKQKYMSFAELVQALASLYKGDTHSTTSAPYDAVNTLDNGILGHSQLQESIDYANQKIDQSPEYKTTLKILQEFQRASENKQHDESAQEFIRLVTSIIRITTNNNYHRLKPSNTDIQNLIAAVKKIPDTKLQYDFLCGWRNNNFCFVPALLMTIAQNEHATWVDLFHVLYHARDLNIDKETYAKIFNDMAQLAMKEIRTEKNKDFPNSQYIENIVKQIRGLINERMLSDSEISEIRALFNLDKIMALGNYTEKAKENNIAKIASLNDKNTKQAAEIANAKIKNQELEAEIANLNDKNTKQAVEIANMKIKNQELEAEIARLKEENSKQKADQNRLREQLDQKDKEIASKDKIIALKEAALNHLKEMIQKARKILEETKLITNSKIAETWKSLGLDK